MVEQELGDVFDAIEALVRHHGADPVQALVEDSTALCRYLVETDRIDEALTGLDELTRSGASTIISLDVAGSTVVFSSGPSATGRWSLGGDLAEIGWPDDRDVEAVGTAELSAHWRSTAVLASASVEILLVKEYWTEPIEREVDAAVWVGPRLQGFIAWIHDRPPESSLGVLLRDGPAVVLLRDWSGSPARLGPNLALADLAFRSTPVAAEVAWPRESEGWQRRALTLEVEECPESLRADLVTAIAWSATLLLAEEAGGDTARPDRNGTTKWQLRRLPAETPAVLPSVVLLARWVSAEPSATRLAVARSIAAERLADPFSTGTSTILLEAAEIAYRQTVDASVHAALAAQRELEQSFRSIDAEFTTVRAHLIETLDQTLLRAAAGLVVIAAAAAATDQTTPGFVRFGSLLVAAYVLFTATVQLAMARRDVEERLRAFKIVITGRGSGLAVEVLRLLDRWGGQLRSRLRWMRVALVVGGLVVAGGGLVVASAIGPANRDSPGPVPTTLTTVASSQPPPTGPASTPP